MASLPNLRGGARLGVRELPELNTLIGIRGSGKSSVLETLRQGLKIPLGDKAADQSYKKNLPRHALGSGGKTTIRIVDPHGQEHEVKRIEEGRLAVYTNGELQTDISSIEGTILKSPLYFGQKDLSGATDGFENDLVEKLLGNTLVDLRRRIQDEERELLDAVRRLNDSSEEEERKKEYEENKKNAEFRLKAFQKHGVEEKLQKRLSLQEDERKCARIVKTAESYLDELEDVTGRHTDELANQLPYKSKHYGKFFEEFLETYQTIAQTAPKILNTLADGRKELARLRLKKQEFDRIMEDLADEFAKTERNLASELQGQNVRPDDYLKLQRTVAEAKERIAQYKKQGATRDEIRREISASLQRLDDLRQNEFQEIEKALANFTAPDSKLKIRPKYRGERERFVDFLTEIFRGNNLRRTTFEKLAEHYPDCGAIYDDLEGASEIFGNSAAVFKEHFLKNLAALLPYQVLNRFAITYHGKELKHHSLGQRASALLLFVMGREENDVIIIDQPEDDLDNQTIYEDVIRLIRKRKGNVQFLFATHNPNIPVLGDAEQIVACRQSDNGIRFETGGVDDPAMQQNLVKIMEGGEEAFERRKEIYRLWKPKNSEK